MNNILFKSIILLESVTTKLRVKYKALNLEPQEVYILKLVNERSDICQYGLSSEINIDVKDVLVSIEELCCLNRGLLNIVSNDKGKLQLCLTPHALNVLNKIKESEKMISSEYFPNVDESTLKELSEIIGLLTKAV
jgi:DNA-directed RNA polymerase specialized sigma subunit